MKKEHCTYTQPQVNAALGQMRTCGCYCRWISSPLCFGRGSAFWNAVEKCDTCQFSKQKGSITLVRADSGGMHIVQNPGAKGNGLESGLSVARVNGSYCKGDSGFMRWNRNGSLAQEISALIPGVKFSLLFTWFHWPRIPDGNAELTQSTTAHDISSVCRKLNIILPNTHHNTSHVLHPFGPIFGLKWCM